MVEKWFADFKRGRMNTDDAERSGRPNSAFIPENIKKSTKRVWRIVKWNGVRQLTPWKYQKPVYSLFCMNIEKDSIRLLTVDQKQ